MTVTSLTHLMREMYLTARRQTRTEPQTMPESRGLSQYRRELSWAEVSHMMVITGDSDTGDWRLEASLASPGAQTRPGLNIPTPTV